MSDIRTRRRARPSTVVGVLLLCLGLGCLGWLGYQYFGSNVISARAFDDERQQLRGRWSNPSNSARSASRGQSEPAGSGRSGSPTAPGDAIALLRIPAFGSGYEVPILNGTDASFLARGVGHYAGSAAPGAVGNFALAGHRVTHGEPFAALLNLKPGDEVVVETQTAVYTYVLDTSPGALTVSEDAGWVLDPVPGHPRERPRRALITLTTCQDLFHSPDRSIGFGHLQSTTNK